VLHFGPWRIDAALLLPSAFGRCCVANQVIEVHRAPSGDQYTDVTEHRGNATVSPLALPAVTITIGQILG
jgi:hypothetical protein